MCNFRFITHWTQRICCNRKPLSYILMFRMDNDLLHPHMTGNWGNKLSVSSHHWAQQCEKQLTFNTMSWQTWLRIFREHICISRWPSLTTITFFLIGGNSPLTATLCQCRFPIDWTTRSPCTCSSSQQEIEEVGEQSRAAENRSRPRWEEEEEEKKKIRVPQQGRTG